MENIKKFLGQASCHFITTGAFLYRSRLMPVPQKLPLEDLGVTDDQFVVAVDSSQKGFNAAITKEIFKKFHATQVIERKI